MKKRVAALMLLLTVVFSISASAYYNVPLWADVEVNLADEAGVIPEILDSADMSERITRREFCHVAVAIYEAVSGQPVESVSESPFSDVDDATVTAAYELGIVNGYPNGNFLPDALIDRQELFVMLSNLLGIYLGEIKFAESEMATCLGIFPDGDKVDSWAKAATVAMITFGVSNGSESNGAVYILPKTTTTRTEAVITGNRLLTFLKGRIPEPEPEVPEGVIEPGSDIAAWGSSCNKTQKLEFLFGTTTDWKYTSSAEAEADMEWVSFPIWRLAADGTKYTDTASVQVHKKLAKTVEQIFIEIYNGEEQFPIKDIGGYSWRGDGTSEHNWGLAIDINYQENYYINFKTGVTVGKYWKPGEDPYSIPADGDVVNAFHKYGFGWGGDGWWSTSRDYMHFSFLST